MRALGLAILLLSGSAEAQALSAGASTGDVAFSFGSLTFGSVSGEVFHSQADVNGSGPAFDFRSRWSGNGSQYVVAVSATDGSLLFVVDNQAEVEANSLALSYAVCSTSCTINAVSGQVKLQAGAQTVVVTDGLVDSNGVVLITQAGTTFDATATRFVVDSSSGGSFTIKANSTATADVFFNFLVIKQNDLNQ